MMQCNIDARGKRIRLIGGLMVLAVGMLLVVIAGFLGGWWWVLAASALAGGAFQVFEARKGWCALRAMGIRTPV